MVNVYVMQDRVSGAFGPIFESPNDETVKRDFINIASNPNIPDYAIFDTVVFYLGYFDQDENDFYLVSGGVPRIVLRGDNNEIRNLRKKVSDETSSESC